MVVCESDNYAYLKQSIQSIIDQTLKPSEIILIINGYFESNNIDDLKNEFSNKNGLISDELMTRITKRVKVKVF